MWSKMQVFNIDDSWSSLSSINVNSIKINKIRYVNKLIIYFSVAYLKSILEILNIINDPINTIFKDYKVVL